MNLFKSFLATITYSLITKIIALWIFFDLIFQVNLPDQKFHGLINGTIEFVLVLLFIWKIEGRNGFDKLGVLPKFYFIALGLGILMVPFQIPLNWIYRIMSGFEHKIHLDLNFENLFYWNSLKTVLMIPIAEELFFRQYIQKRLHQNYKPLMVIISVAILFSFIHIHFETLFFTDMKFSAHQGFICFFGGLISGLLYFKTRNVLPSVIFHVTWNLAATLS